MFYDNLKAICEIKGLKITPLVLECGGTKGVIGGWKKGAVPNSDIVMRLSVRLNVPTDYLLFGKENSPSTELTEDEQELIIYYNKLKEENKTRVRERAETLAELETKTVKSEPKNITKTVLKQPKTVTFTELDQATEDTYTYIDLYDMPASAGTGVYLTGNACEPLKVQCNSLTAEANFAVEVRGGSMEPKFYDGDIVLIKTQPCIEVGEIGIFIINEEGYIKEFGGDKLISINSKYNDVIIRDDDSCYCKGKVIGVLENDDILE